MYDSENFSLVTRIEAGAGVNVVHSTNSEGENIWTASVDETWLINWVNSNSAGSLKLNDSDEARIRVLENKLGLTTTTTVTTAAPASIPAGTTGTTEVTVTGDVAALSDTITMTYNLTDAGGDNLVSETLVGSSGASPTTVLMAIYSQMKRNNGMLLFMTPTFDFANGKLILTWKDASVGSTFTYSIASQAAGDNIVFTASDY
jgi:hypothetical protein